MRQKSSQRDELFLTSVHLIGVEAYCMNQKVNPLVSGEFLSLVYIILKVNVRDLNRFQNLDFPSHFYILTLYIADSDYTPYSVS